MNTQPYPVIQERIGQPEAVESDAAKAYRDAATQSVVTTSVLPKQEKMNKDSKPQIYANGESVQGDDQDDDFPRIGCFTPFLEHGLKVNPDILAALKRRGGVRRDTPPSDIEGGHE